jgi:hypothetical protein
MTIHSTLCRSAASIAALGLATVLLAGCMITSATNLVSPGEAATPLPASFSMTTFAYEDGTYLRSDEEPAAYTLNGSFYADDAESIQATFVPLEGTQYLVALAGEDSTIYGVARIANDVMEIRMLLSGDIATDLPSPPAGIEIIDGGITVTDRAGLDAAIALVRDGTIATDPLLAWIGTAEAPATLFPENGWYRVQ